MTYSNISTETSIELDFSEWILRAKFMEIIDEIRLLIYPADQSLIRETARKLIKGQCIVGRNTRFPEKGYFVNIYSSYTARLIDNIFTYTNHRLQEDESYVLEKRGSYIWSINELLALNKYKQIYVEDKKKIDNVDKAPQVFSRKSFESYYGLIWEE